MPIPLLARDSPWRQNPADVTPPHEGGPEQPGARHPYTRVMDWHARYPQEILLHGPGTVKRCALTFDDGPDNRWTPRIATVLESYGVRGTFMCVGQRVAQNPHVLQHLVQGGHIVGNHSWSHPNLTQLTPEQIRWQMERTDDEIQQVAGIRPRFFRPPYGAMNEDVIRIAVALRYKILYWDVDSLDWSGLTAAQVVTNVMSHVHPGTIVLMHSAGGRCEDLSNTVQALPVLIRILRREGYQLVTVPELLGEPAYFNTSSAIGNVENE
jgi:peptidoglycan/xylan/chitin deacetylase (PgdA/CDA1 family)